MFTDRNPPCNYPYALPLPHGVIIRQRFHLAYIVVTDASFWGTEGMPF